MTIKAWGPTMDRRLANRFTPVFVGAYDC